MIFSELIKTKSTHLYVHLYPVSIKLTVLEPTFHHVDSLNRVSQSIKLVSVIHSIFDDFVLENDHF